MQRPVVDLPQPDSPTSPNVSPRRMVKLTSSTALTVSLPAPNKARPAGKYFFRLLTSTRLPLSLCIPSENHVGAVLCGRPRVIVAQAGATRNGCPYISNPVENCY